MLVPQCSYGNDDVYCPINMLVMKQQTQIIQTTGYLVITTIASKCMEWLIINLYGIALEILLPYFTKIALQSPL